jgi:hypothetical protein
MAMLGLVTAAIVLGWLRWRCDPAPAQVPAGIVPRRQANVAAAPEPLDPARTTLPGPGTPERRIARSGPHADSPVAALLRRARRARREAHRAG